MNIYKIMSRFPISFLSKEGNFIQISSMVFIAVILIILIFLAGFLAPLAAQKKIVTEYYPYFSSFLLFLVFVPVASTSLRKKVGIIMRKDNYYLKNDGEKIFSSYLFIFVTLGCIALFVLPLLNSWHSAYNSNTLFGLFPASDGSNYYMGAEELVYTGKTDSFTGRRPINTSLFSLRLALTGDSYKGALYGQSFLLGISCLLAALMILNDFGKIPALLFAILVFLFGSKYVASPLTEALGLSLGLLSFILLWLGASRRKIWIFTFGALMLTIAFNARPGTILILPCLILWAWIFFDGRKLVLKIWEMKGLVITVIAILLGFLFQIAVIYATTGKMDAGHDNFVHLVYATSIGETGWKSYQGLPEEKQKHLWKESWQEIKKNPVNLIRGLGKRFNSFVVVSSVELFQTVSFFGGRLYLPPGLEREYNLPTIYKILKYNSVRFFDVAFHLLMLGNGLLFLFRNRKRPEYVLIILMITGYYLSGIVLGNVAIPRVIHTTIPLILFLYVLGAYQLIVGAPEEHKSAPYDAIGNCNWVCSFTVFFSIFIMIAIVSGPSLANSLSGMAGGNDTRIERIDEDYMVIRGHKRLPHINILPDSEKQITCVPDILYKDYLEALKQPYTSKVRYGFTQLQDFIKPPLSIALAYNFSSIDKPRATFIIGPLDMLPEEPRMMKLSGHFMIPDGATKQFFVVDDYENLPEEE